jgi:hypothetical protein
MISAAKMALNLQNICVQMSEVAETILRFLATPSTLCGEVARKSAELLVSF